MARTTKVEDIWSKPKMLEMLQQPIGAPIALTRQEALEIIRLAAGRRPDLPSGVEFVRDVRPGLGYSIMERMKEQRQGLYEK